MVSGNPKIPGSNPRQDIPSRPENRRHLGHQAKRLRQSVHYTRLPTSHGPGALHTPHLTHTRHTHVHTYLHTALPAHPSPLVMYGQSCARGRFDCVTVCAMRRAPWPTMSCLCLVSQGHFRRAAAGTVFEIYRYYTGMAFFWINFEWYWYVVWKVVPLLISWGATSIHFDFRCCAAWFRVEYKP